MGMCHPITGGSCDQQHHQHSLSLQTEPSPSPVHHTVPAASWEEGSWELPTHPCKDSSPKDAVKAQGNEGRMVPGPTVPPGRGEPPVAAAAVRSMAGTL